MPCTVTVVVLVVSPLGLVEMTRQNITDGVREILTKRCPTCDGEGVVESEETVAIDVLRHLRVLAADNPKPEAFLIRVNPKVARKLLENWLYWLVIDGVTLGLALERGLHLTAALFALYLVLVVIGWRRWLTTWNGLTKEAP